MHATPPDPASPSDASLKMAFSQRRKCGRPHCGRVNLAEMYGIIVIVLRDTAAINLFGDLTPSLASQALPAGAFGIVERPVRSRELHAETEYARQYGLG